MPKKKIRNPEHHVKWDEDVSSVYLRPPWCERCKENGLHRSAIRIFCGALLCKEHAEGLHEIDMENLDLSIDDI